jgi:hypothetical protein
LSAEWPHLGVASGGTDYPDTGSGLTFSSSTEERTGTLNGSSPTANLAGVNIKGNEAFLHFPQTFKGRFISAVAVIDLI